LLSRRELLMTWKANALVLIAFSCLVIGDSAGQQPPASVTAQSSLAGTPIQTDQSSVGLDALVDEALQKNPAIQSALHSVAAQRRRVPQAKALPDPTVGIGWA